MSCPVCDGEDDECDCTAVDGEWTAAVRALLARPPHAEIVFEKDAVPDPENSGFARARGKPVGQTADYRLPLRTGGCVHVREFEDRYEVHRDRVAPSASRVGHLLVDMPLETATVVAVVALGLVRGGPSAGSIARRTLLASAGLLPGWN